MLKLKIEITDMNDGVGNIVTDNEKDLILGLNKLFFNNGRNGYKTEDVHVLYWNDRKIYAWMNSKNFHHFMIDGDHYFINKEGKLVYNKSSINKNKLKEKIVNLRVGHNIYDYVVEI